MKLLLSDGFKYKFGAGERGDGGVLSNYGASASRVIAVFTGFPV